MKRQGSKILYIPFFEKPGGIPCFFKNSEAFSAFFLNKGSVL